MDNRKCFREMGFGLMLHFGLYSILGGEWKGTRIPGIGEWIQHQCRIPGEEYHRLTSVFNPLYFDAEEIVKTAQSAGMKYIVITSKHHEGFALFRSKADPFNVVDATPFKRDIIGELAEACYRHGMKLGLYYSQELDWAHPHGGGYPGPGREDGIRWTNDWDFPDNSRKNYSICFEEKILPQMTEILTGYGDLFLIWCDTPYVISDSQSRQIYNLIKHYQPGCLVNSRIGNGMGDYTSADDNFIPSENPDNLLYETPATLNDTWGYKSFDNNWKTPETVAATRNHLRKIGVNYLLNVGPDALGRLPGPAVEILRRVGELE